MIGSIVRDVIDGRIGITINEDLDWDWDGFEEISYLIHWISTGQEDWLDYCEYDGFGTHYVEIA